MPMPLEEVVPAESEFGQALRRAALRLRRRRTAESQAELLASMSERWLEMTRIRDYLAALEARLPRDSRSAAMADWLSWARDHVDQLDPLSDQGLADLQTDAEALAPDPIDDEPPDPEEQYFLDMGWLDDLLDGED